MSTVKANTFLDSAGGNTATINGIPLRQGVLDPENRIINGAFDFWQRGTSFNSGTYQGYIADRWRLDRVGGFASAERQSETLGTVLGSSNPQFFVRAGVSSQTLSSHVAFIEQLIEGVRSYAGQTITVLGWARRAAGSGNIATQVSQVFGTGGSPSAAVGVNGQQVALTGSWAPFAVTFTVPSIPGKTLGTNGNDYLVLRFYLSAGADYSGQANSLGLQTITVDFWGIHIKLGTHTVDTVGLYKQPELGPELARCQRYYEVGAHQFGSAAVDASGITYSHVPLKVSKRSATYSIAKTDQVLTNSNASFVTVDTQNGFDIQASALATGSLHRVRVTWAVDAEL